MPFYFADAYGIAGLDAGFFEGADYAGADEALVELDVGCPVIGVDHDGHALGGGPVHDEYAIVLDAHGGPAAARRGPEDGEVGVRACAGWGGDWVGGVLEGCQHGVQQGVNAFVGYG